MKVPAGVAAYLWEPTNPLSFTNPRTFESTWGRLMAYADRPGAGTGAGTGAGAAAGGGAEPAVGCPPYPAENDYGTNKKLTILEIPSLMR